MTRRIGDIVVERGYASREEVDQAIAQAAATHRRTGRVLVDEDVITEDQLARVVADRYDVRYVDLAGYRLDPSATALLDPAIARRYECLPISFDEDDQLIVAMADPSDVLALDDVELLTGHDRVARVAVAPSLLREAVIRLQHETYAGEEAGVPLPADAAIDLRESPAFAPLINLLNSIIGRAVEQGASDIHLDRDADEMHVRYRIDGVTSDVTTIPARLAPGVVSRVKIMSGLDIGEHRVPQDGRVGMSVAGTDVDVRVVVLPVIHGESVVMRLLRQGDEMRSLDALGMTPGARERFDAAIAKPYGGILSTGPTGSGKTTTQYAALALLNSRERTIVTIEDPVEYRLDGVKQMQVSEQRGLTFARALRSILRADPDVVLVGEIRDRETAQIAIEAALTGHLVLSTLHTNDAPTAVTRLLEMGLEPFLVASSIACVVGQRLTRVLCTHCRRPVTITPEVARANGFEIDSDMQAFEAVGCEHCHGSGYSGRVGLYEVMPVTPEIAAMILARRSSDEIATLARQQGMVPMAEDGLAKVRAGVTSFEEVMRVARAQVATSPSGGGLRNSSSGRSSRHQLTAA